MLQVGPERRPRERDVDDERSNGRAGDRAGPAGELVETRTQAVITDADLDWWVTRAATLQWTFARTYAATAPHSYVVHGRTVGMTEEDYVRAARVIHTYGRPAKFYGMTSIYLTSPDGQLKWWTMDAYVTETNLVNQATTDRLYGVQNAPSTESGVYDAYDEVATAYDAFCPTDPALAAAVRTAVVEHSGDDPPRYWMSGAGPAECSTSASTKPDRYAGVDPSQPMLNQLVRKFPNVGAIYPMPIEHAIAEEAIHSRPVRDRDRCWARQTSWAPVSTRLSCRSRAVG